LFALPITCMRSENQTSRTTIPRAVMLFTSKSYDSSAYESQRENAMLVMIRARKMTAVVLNRSSKREEARKTSQEDDIVEGMGSWVHPKAKSSRITRYSNRSSQRCQILANDAHGKSSLYSKNGYSNMDSTQKMCIRRQIVYKSFSVEGHLPTVVKIQ
jgi:hypothetical protein